jgi:four helix bundle protein
MKMTAMGDFTDMIVYQKVYNPSMEIFSLGKKFPPEEGFSFTDQIRRSSQSI